MTVKNTKRPGKAKARQPLTLSEREVFQATKEFSAANDGAIPKLQQLIDAVNGRIKQGRVSAILKRLEEKGYIRRKLEILKDEAVA